MIRISVGEYFLNISKYLWMKASSLVSSSIENSARKRWDNIVGMLFSIEQYWESCWVQHQSKSSIFDSNDECHFPVSVLTIGYKYNRESVHGEKEVWVLLTISVHTPDMSSTRGKKITGKQNLILRLSELLILRVVIIGLERTKH